MRDVDGWRFKYAHPRRQNKTSTPEGGSLGVIYTQIWKNFLDVQKNRQKCYLRSKSALSRVNQRNGQMNVESVIEWC